MKSQGITNFELKCIQCGSINTKVELVIPSRGFGERVFLQCKDCFNQEELKKNFLSCYE